MLKFTHITKAILLLSLLACALTNAQIAGWDYEPQLGPINNPTSNTGSGTSAVVNNGGGVITPGIRVGMTGTGCGAQTTGNAWALEPFAPGSTNESNGAQFNASTVGYQNITFTWDQRWSNTAPNTARFQYTTDGITWTNLIMTAGNTGFCLGSINAAGCFETNSTGDIYRRVSVNLSAITAVNNNPNFGVRILAAFYQSTGQFRQANAPSTVATSVGTWRFDNVAVGGTLLPGPTASAISAVAPTTICAGSSGNIKVNITGGTGPFTIVYYNGTSNVVVSNYTSGSNIAVSPAAGANTTYTLVSVTNANGQAGTGNSGSAVIAVRPVITITASDYAACPGAADLTASTSVAFSPAGGTLTYSTTIVNPTAYTGATINSYTYTYTYMGCSVTSLPVTFTRKTLPAVNLQPLTATQSTCQGTPFATPISTTAGGTAPYTYQWYSNTTASTVTGAIVLLNSAADIAIGSQTAAYTPPTNVAGTLYYFVRIYNSCGNIKSNISGAFTVLPASVSGMVSSAQTICAGTQPADLSLSGNSGAIIKWQKATDSGFTTGVQDIANTSSTLTGATIGTLSQTTYFRAFIQNGTCPTAVTMPIQILIKSTTWNGSWSNGVPDSVTTAIFTANYSSTGNLNACAVLVNSGNVVFNTGHTLTIQNGLTVSGGTLTFEDSSSLVQVNNSANSGNVTYKRITTAIRKYDYTYWSSPVNAEIIASLSPLTLSDKYYLWDTAIYNWSGIASPASTLMAIARGYIIRAPQNFDPVTAAVFNGSFNGIPNNGDYTVSINVAGANNLNLLGNPYPSAISADLLMSDPSNAASLGTGSSIYLWTHNTPITAQQYAPSDYAVYNYTGGIGTSAALGSNSNIPNGFIAAGQAFFIKGLATGTATFKNSMRSATNSQFYRHMQQTYLALDKSRIWLELKSEAGAYKQLLAGYVEGATDGLDRGFDAEVLESGNSVSFYSILDNAKLAIQGKAVAFNDSDEIPLGYRADAGGNFEIKLSAADGLFDNQNIYLEDKLLHMTYDLKVNSYQFVTEAGTFDDRFVIRFNNTQLAVTENAVTGNALFIFKENGNLVANAGNQKIQEVRMFDIAGRLVLERKNIDTTEVSLGSAQFDGVVIIQVLLDNGNLINRKIANWKD